jgi:hypothetical protein
MPEKLGDQPNARADSQRRRCYPFQRTQVTNPFAGIIKVQRVGANLVAWTSDLDVRGNVYHKVTSQSAPRADAVEIIALAINICCYHIGSLEKEHEQACHDRNHHESEHV